MKKVILVSGRMRSGKNQFADYLEQSYILNNKSVVQTYFAKPLKDESKEDFKPLTKYLNELLDNILECIPEDDRDEDLMYNLMKLHTLDDNFYENKTDITRIILQMYGTDIFRKRVDNDYWVKRMIDKIEKSDKDVTIITDVRFPNEIEMLRDIFDITVIRVERDLIRIGDKHNHISETSLDNYDKFDYIINNNSTLEDLWKDSDVIYNKMNRSMLNV